jgi:hypothetical protein
MIGYPLCMLQKELGDDRVKRISEGRAVVEEGTTAAYCLLPIILECRVYDKSGHFEN